MVVLGACHLLILYRVIGLGDLDFLPKNHNICHWVLEDFLWPGEKETQNGCGLCLMIGLVLEC